MILAFSGKKGTGKTTAALYLKKKYGFKIVSFAGELKNQAKELMPFSEDHLNGKLKETLFQNYDWSPREFMIKFGQFMRYWDKDYWVKRAVAKMLKEPKDHWAVDDLRYLNEAKSLKAEKAVLIRIDRYKKYNPFPNGKFENDESEVQLDSYKKFDYKIEAFHNIKLADLYRRLDIAMREQNVSKL